MVTVACDPDSTNYTAIAGGVQVLGLGDGADSRNTPVSSSFPGRMNWDTKTPKTAWRGRPGDPEVKMNKTVEPARHDRVLDSRVGTPLGGRLTATVTTCPGTPWWMSI